MTSPATPATNSAAMNDILAILVDIGLIDPPAPAADLEPLRAQVRNALRDAARRNLPLRGLIAPNELEAELTPWAARHGWDSVKESRDESIFIAPEVLGERRTWRAYDQVSLLIVTREASRALSETTPVAALPASGRVLRGYQTETIGAVHAQWNGGTPRVLVRLPTGTGKSVVISKIAAQHVREGGVVVLMAHRIELIDQLADHMRREGVPADQIGKLMSGHRPTRGQNVIVSTVQSSRKLRALMGDQYAGQPLLVVIDEAHRSASTQYQNALVELRPDRVLGVTATPVRTDGRGLGDVFGAMVGTLSYAKSFEPHDDNGGRPYLVRPRYFAPTIPDLERVRVTGGDYNERDLEGEMMRPQIVGSVVEHAVKYASQRLTIAFAATVNHAQALCAAFNTAGLMAEIVHGGTDSDERADIIARFRRGEFSVLVNVAIATEGLDVPEVDCVINARPTKSVALWLQMVGRGMRPAQGKSDFIVLDHGGTFLDLGPVEDYEEWSLEPSKGKNAQNAVGQSPVERTCRCGHSWVGTARCPSCGAVGNSRNWTAENRASLDADLVEVQRREDPALRQSRLKRSLSVEEREIVYATMRRLASSRGMNPDAAYYWYRDLFGVRPQSKLRPQQRASTDPKYLELAQRGMDLAAQKQRIQAEAWRAGDEKLTEEHEARLSAYTAAGHSSERAKELWSMMLHYAANSTASGKAGQAWHWFRELLGAEPLREWGNEPAEPDDDARLLIANHIAKQRAAWFASRGRRHQGPTR